MTKDTFAEIISHILGPKIWFPVLIFSLILKTDVSVKNIPILLAAFFIFQIILPALLFIVLIRYKKIKDWDIRERKERYKILPFFMTSTLVVVVTAYFYGSILFFHLIFALWLISSLGILVTYFWKISLHMILNTSAVIILNFLFDWTVPYLYLLIPIIAWARYHAKHHTLAQIIGGVILSILVVLSLLAYFGYI